MIYSGRTENDQNALRVREHRGQIRRLYRNLYTDDFDSPADQLVTQNILAIAAVLLPDWQLSHSSAAVRGPVDRMLFMSGPGKPGRHLDLPGIRIVRLRELKAPECDEIPTPTMIARGVDAPAEVPLLRVSTPLQIIFECLSSSRAYPQKSLADLTVSEMIRRLPASDRERAERFAARNGLRREYLRFRELSFETVAAEHTRLAEPDSANIYFYGWEIGTLTYLGGGEYRFTYDPDWPIPLSSELPIGRGTSYEGRGMPAFFENCLPEGWTESVVLASNKLSPEDLFGLFSTTRKYLSNITLRPLDIPEADLVYDAHSERIADLVPGPDGVVHLREEIGDLPGDVSLWRRARADGPLRLSGVQAKLPVSLYRRNSDLAIGIGDLRHACTHILKIPTSQHPGVVENEWATMELARRMGLPVATTTMVRFQEGSLYRGSSLLVERYDIPDRVTLDEATSDALLFLQEDACSLLLLRRSQKYNTSMERIADALMDSGLSQDDLRQFLILVMLSWVLGNGDLHAKNISVLRRFRTGRPGEPPVLEGVRLAPFYDLVNTRIHIPDDHFAVPIDGRANNIGLKSFAQLANRWDMSRDEVRGTAEWLIPAIHSHLEAVLVESHLPEDLQAQYKAIVDENSRTLV